jgi:hypothetical protein
MQQSESPSARPMVQEVKEKFDGRVQTFALERWLQTPDLFVGRWVAEAGNDFGAPVGLMSWGVWWRTRAYGAYRIHAADGSLLLYRFDALDRVRIDVGGVRYRDLLLDARIRRDADGAVTVRLEDEDEVAEAVTEGTLSTRAQRRVRWTRALFMRGADRLLARVDTAIELAERSEFPSPD